MVGINRVILVGYLGSNPEVRYTTDGIAVCNFSVATTEKFTDRHGNRHERTEWHKIVTWRKLAEICNKYLTKGKQVYIEGKIRNENWEKDGVKQHSYKIDVDVLKILSSIASESNIHESEQISNSLKTDIADDDIPF